MVRDHSANSNNTAAAGADGAPAKSEQQQQQSSGKARSQTAGQKQSAQNAQQNTQNPQQNAQPPQSQQSGELPACVSPFTELPPGPASYLFWTAMGVGKDSYMFQNFGVYPFDRLNDTGIARAMMMFADVFLVGAWRAQSALLC